MSDDLDALVRELEGTAQRLRGGELEQREAAELVERCAALATQIGRELDRRGREADADAAAEGQERLL